MKKCVPIKESICFHYMDGYVGDKKIKITFLISWTISRRSCDLHSHAEEE